MNIILWTISPLIFLCCNLIRRKCRLPDCPAAFFLTNCQFCPSKQSPGALLRPVICAAPDRMSARPLPGCPSANSLSVCRCIFSDELTEYPPQDSHISLLKNGPETEVPGSLKPILLSYCTGSVVECHKSYEDSTVYYVLYRNTELHGSDPVAEKHHEQTAADGLFKGSHTSVK